MRDQWGRTTEQRVSELWWTVYGIDGRKGVRGTQRDHAKRIGKLERFEADIRLLWSLARWSALAIGTVVGIMASGPAGQIIAALLTAQ